MLLVASVLAPFGLLMLSLQINSLPGGGALSHHLAFSIAISLILALAVPGLVLEWLIGSRISQLRQFCSQVKLGRYRELLKLPNELNGGQDEEELTMLMRDMNWMARQIDLRQQEMLDSASRIEQQKQNLLAVNEQLRQVQAKKQQQADEMASLCQRMKKMAMTDPLTEIANRRCFFDTLQQRAAYDFCEDGLIALLIIDVDHFKKINDTHGHQTGDKVLQELTKIIGAVTRKEDLLARIGGEEFGLLIANASIALARNAAKRICDVVAATPIVIDELLTVTATVSIGVGMMCACPCVPDYERLYLYADQALYYSKKHGRNGVAFYNVETGAIDKVS
jgi:diguanylate cyclase (GGDEF)-like protein